METATDRPLWMMDDQETILRRTFAVLEALHRGASTTDSGLWVVVELQDTAENAIENLSERAKRDDAWTADSTAAHALLLSIMAHCHNVLTAHDGDGETPLGAAGELIQMGIERFCKETHAEHVPVVAAVAITAAATALEVVVPQSIDDVDWENIEHYARMHYDQLLQAEKEITDAVGGMAPNEEGAIFDAQAAVGAILCVAVSQMKLENVLTIDDALAVCLREVDHLCAINERVE